MDSGAVRADDSRTPSNSARPFSVNRRTSYSPPPRSSNIASEPFSLAGPNPTEVQKQLSSYRAQASVTMVAASRRRK